MRPLRHPGGGGRHRRGQPTQRATREEHSRAWAAAPGGDVSGSAPAGPSRTNGTTPPCRPPVSLMERQQHSSSSINTGRPEGPARGARSGAATHTHTLTRPARGQGSGGCCSPPTPNCGARFHTALSSHRARSHIQEPHLTDSVSHQPERAPEARACTQPSGPPRVAECAEQHSPNTAANQGRRATERRASTPHQFSLSQRGRTKGRKLSATVAEGGHERSGHSAQARFPGYEHTYTLPLWHRNTSVPS